MRSVKTFTLTNWQKLALLMVTALFFLGGHYVSNYPEKQKEQGLKVGHSQQIISQLDMIALHMTQAETGQRGYLLTGGQTSYLAPYTAAIGQIEGDLERLETMTLNVSPLHERVPQLRRLVSLKMAELKETISAVKNTHTIMQSMDLVRSGRGQKMMADIMHEIDSMRREEAVVQQQYREFWQRAVSQARSAFLTGEISLYVLMAAIFFALYRVAQDRSKLAEAETRISASQRAETQRLANIVSLQKEIAGHTHDLREALQTIVEEVRNLVEAEGCIIEMMEGDEMVYQAAAGSAATFIGLRLPAKNSLSGMCVEQNAALKCDDSETDPRVNKEACRRIGLRAMIVVPLRHRGQAVGVLKVLSSEAYAFTDETVAALELIAGAVSGSLSDAVVADSLRTQNQKLETANTSLEKLASTDGLTGLQNHRTFKDMLSREYDRAKRHDKPLSLILFDVDHFKAFNDNFGHPVGDSVLKRIGQILIETCRTSDYAARYGGEEFAIILPETSIDGARIIAERLREVIADDAWQHRKVTVSMGVSALSEETSSVAAFLDMTDKALYASKESGRNRVTCA